MYDAIEINGIEYNRTNLDRLVDDCPKPAPDWLRDLYLFLQDWFSGKESFWVKTSGSTGDPKKYEVSRQAMIASAQRTLAFFNLRPGQKALLCLPVSFIAGKMMVVRALVGQLSLVVVEPSGLPLQHIDSPIDFAAFTPMQMMGECSRQPNPHLNLLRKVIIGGGAVHSSLQDLLQKAPFVAYETYGMTETLTHVALRKINGADAQSHFTPLPGVKTGTDQRGCLVVDVQAVTNGPLVTNDVVQRLANGSFVVTGRFDNVINSGGIKVQPEEVERIGSAIVQQIFYISSVQHESLGEQVVMVVDQLPTSPGELLQKLKPCLTRYQLPASIFVVEEFPKTPLGKINRGKLKDLLIHRQPVFSRPASHLKK